MGSELGASLRGTELVPHPRPSGRSAKPIKCWVQSHVSWRWPEAGLVWGSGSTARGGSEAGRGRLGQTWDAVWLQRACAGHPGVVAGSSFLAAETGENSPCLTGLFRRK